jgi:glycosyltransferase involved in cell wall biosynthesis
VLKDQAPKVTVITVCFNAMSSIASTIKSVAEQSYFNQIEYLVIDGNSNDGTIAFLNSQLSVIDKLISEPDKGIYDAMNKGILNASGDWIIFLNAGDIFFNEKILENIFPYLSDADVVYGKTLVYDNVHQEKLNRGYPLSMDWKVIPYCHQSVLIKRTFLTKCLFDTNYKIAADYNQYFNLKKLGCQFKLIEETISVYDNNGFSANNMIKLLNEYERISLKNSNGAYQFIKIKIYFLLKKVLLKIR